LVHLRNPWGKGEWTGEYSDSSTAWTEKYKNQLGWSDVDDGAFYMKVEDFIDNFEGVTICHYRENYFLSSMHDLNGENTFATYQFNIESTGDYYFGLS
jgi:calpain-15